jgi:hypothetical protein
LLLFVPGSQTPEEEPGGVREDEVAVSDDERAEAIMSGVERPFVVCLMVGRERDECDTEAVLEWYGPLFADTEVEVVEFEDSVKRRRPGDLRICWVAEAGVEIDVALAVVDGVGGFVAAEGVMRAFRSICSMSSSHFTSSVPLGRSACSA